MEGNENGYMSFISYNATGFNAQRAEFLIDICNEMGRSQCFVAVQEHFLLDRNTGKIENLLPNDFNVYPIGSFKDTTQVRRGRGKGGLAQIWPKSLDHLISRIPVPNAKRVQGSLIALPTSKILWINTYFPGDPGNDNVDEIELRHTLSGIKWLIDNNVHDHIIWAGDINADFKRDTRHVTVVQDFLKELNLATAWSDHHVDFTYSSPDDKSFSCIDHFFYYPPVQRNIAKCGVIHRGDNISGHSPIFLTLKSDNLPHIETCESIRVPKQNWKRATEKDKLDYKSSVSSYLSDIDIPHCITECQDIHCSNLDHKVEIENYIVDIIDGIEKSAKAHIPYRNQQHRNATSKRKAIPGWSTLVKPFKDESVFWHSTWWSAGKPTTGPLYQIMRHTKNQFRYAKRRCENSIERIKRDKFIEACLSGEKDLMDEIKKMKHKKHHVSSKIDGFSKGSDIANHFKEIYESLYNRTGSDEPLRNIHNKVNSSCTIEDSQILDLLTPKLIYHIVKTKIKPNKSDVDADMTTDCIIQAPYELSDHLCKFFTACLVHGYIPEMLLLCSIVMLVKNSRKALDDSNNYRGIAISSLLLKIFDWIVLTLFPNELSLDENQFGFQAQSSTVMCTWTVLEVINWFLSNGSSVYACFLDYRKAFDLVNHAKMFSILLERKVNKLFIRLLIIMYINQKCYIKWAESRSYSFSVTNGTRQGSVFSPVGGFATYIDPLITELRHSGIGCNIKGTWFGSVFYADDGTLLCPSVNGLQKMVDICAAHADINNLEFSTDPNPQKSKTKCIAFSRLPKTDLAPIFLNGDKLPWVDRVVHVGNTLFSNGKMEQDLKEKRGIYIERCMELNQEFMACPNQVKLKMHRLYNSHFTGSSLWDFSSVYFNMLCNSWNVNIRIMLDLPRDTHCYLVEELDDGPHVRNMIYCRYIKFLNTIFNGKRIGMKHLLNLVCRSVYSPTGLNISHISTETGLKIIPGRTRKYELKNHRVYDTPDDQKWRLSLIKGLLDVREAKWEVIFDNETSCLEDDQLLDILNNACSS